MSRDLCRLSLTCRLTKDPELRSTPSGMSVCSMRVAYSTAKKDASGQWTDKSNYLDVTVWGNQGDACAQYLAKGRRIAVDGRLEWREWVAQDGTKRQAYDLVADSVIFLEFKDDDGGSNSGGGGGGGESQFVPAGASAGTDFQGVDNDIPFRATIDGWQ